jgi:hypothetical protein
MTGIIGWKIKSPVLQANTVIGDISSTYISEYALMMEAVSTSET